jgi:hypothetical protein
MTSCPGRSSASSDGCAAETTYERSGSLVLLSGVGTQMEMASHSASRFMSFVAESSPSDVAAAGVDPLHHAAR